MTDQAKPGQTEPPKTAPKKPARPPIGEAYMPSMVAARIEAASGTKATISTPNMILLAIMAGVFIAVGAMFYTLTTTQSGLGIGMEQVLGGVTFSLGLILVVVVGGELFTGNNLMVMAWASRRVSGGQVLWNWSLSYGGNIIGSVAIACIAYLSGMAAMADGAVGEHTRAIAAHKVALPVDQAFFKAILCNMLVCLALLLASSARTVSSKILGIVFPISAMIALGFEHSIANMYLIPAGWLAGEESVTMTSALANLIPVTLGNIVGGVMVALAYWQIYLRRDASGS